MLFYLGRVSTLVGSREQPIDLGKLTGREGLGKDLQILHSILP